MTPDHEPGSCLVTRARVARTRSEVIRQDGAPSTHSVPESAPGRMVFPIPSGHAPHSFTASVEPRSRAALVPWWSLLLSVLALGCLGALVAVLELPAVVGAALSLCLAGCCLVLVVAELVHRVSTWRARS